MIVSSKDSATKYYVNITWKGGDMVWQIIPVADEVFIEDMSFELDFREWMGISVRKREDGTWKMGNGL